MSQDPAAQLPLSAVRKSAWPIRLGQLVQSIPTYCNSDEELSVLGIGSGLLDIVVPQRDVHERSRSAAVDDGEVADRYWSLDDTANADVSVVRVVDEHAGSGLETLQRLAPLAASACTHIAVRPRVFPGTGLVISEHYVIVEAVPL